MLKYCADTGVENNSIARVDISVESETAIAADVVIDAAFIRASNLFLEKMTIPQFALPIWDRLKEKPDERLSSAISLFGDSSDKEHVEDLVRAFTIAVLEELQKPWLELYSDFPTELAKKVSKAERDALGIRKASLVYGEISFVSFGLVFFSHLQGLIPDNAVFYDLGSGTGRGIFAANLLHRFSKLTGIEILEGLHKTSMDVLELYKKTNQNRDNSKSQEINLIQGDLLDYDWSDGDLVFANSTCFEESLMKRMGLRGRFLKPGSIFVTLTKQLKSPYFDVTLSKQYRMSWGIATVHIHRRNDILDTGKDDELEEGKYHDYS